MQSRPQKKVPFSENLLRGSLAIKLVAISLVTFAAIFGYSYLQGYNNTIATLTADAEKELSQISEILESELAGDKTTATALAISVADRNDVKLLVAQKNREALIELLTPLFGQLKEKYQVVHFNVIDERGVVVLRLNNPEKFDDYVAYNYIVTNTLNTKQVSNGLEVDTNGLSMRGAAPVYENAQFVGLIEIGLDYSEAFAKLMKQRTGADYTIWLYKPATVQFKTTFEESNPVPVNENFVFYAGTQKDKTQAKSADFEQAFVTFDNIFRSAFSVGKADATLLVPILGLDETFFGVTEISINYEENIQASQEAGNSGQLARVGLSLIGLIGIGYAINWIILAPLRKISRFAENITRKDTQTELRLKTGDEFEHVAQTLTQMAQAVNQTREDLENLVSQRTAQLQASNEVAKVATSILDPDTLINNVVNLITKSFGYYYAAIFLTSDDGRWAEIKDATGTAGEALKARRHKLQVGGNSMVGSAISSKEAHIALDVGDAPARFNNPLLPNTRSEIALPLIVADHIIGAMDVQSVKEADFMPEDISTLQNMANQVAIALENARLFREMNDSLDELKQANREYVTSAWGERLKSGKMEHATHPNLPAIEAGETIRGIDISLNLREQSIGQISLEVDKEWDTEDQTWVEALATQVAISLENSRLLEESQQAALRERLSASIIQKVWSANNIDAIIQTAVRELGRSLDASEVKIELKVE
jgi:GAF domain-containing protein/HAMP domain-containing protein